MHRIIVADDTQMNRVLIKNILSTALNDLVFFEAENGEEVLNILEENDIDLILLDLIMPVKDGYQTLKEVKAIPRFHDIPVIVNSAINEIHSIEKTLKEGAIDYFTKPLSPNDMTIILPLKAKNALNYYEQNKMINELNEKINDELKNANTFANIMLPKSSNLRDIDLHIKYHPSMGIGGDFFDCYEKDDSVWFMIADVTGHGIAAGMASSMVKILFRKTTEEIGIKPNEVLYKINKNIFDIFESEGRSKFFVFTAFIGKIEKNKLHFSNAGQPYPLLYKKNKNEFNYLEQSGFLIGMMDDIEYDEHSIDIESDDVLFLYTDGLFSCGLKKDFTNWTQVKDLAEKFKGNVGKFPDDFLEDLFYAFHLIHKEKKGDFTDDVALMLLKIK